LQKKKNLQKNPLCRSTATKKISLSLKNIIVAKKKIFVIAMIVNHLSLIRISKARNGVSRKIQPKQ